MYIKMLGLNKISCCLMNNCRRIKLFRPLECSNRIISVNYSKSSPLCLQNEPYKFRGSKAEKYTMDESFYIIENFNPHVRRAKTIVSISLITFLLWFGVFREENHIDEQLKGNYEDFPTNPALEVQLMLKYDHCKRNGMPTEELEKQINLIRKLKGRPPL